MKREELTAWLRDLPDIRGDVAANLIESQQKALNVAKIQMGRLTRSLNPLHENTQAAFEALAEINKALGE